MRIAILASGYLPVLDGVTVSLAARVRRLAAAGHAVLLMAPRAARPPEPEALPAGVTFVALDSAPFGEAAGDHNVRPAARAAIERALDAFRPDVIHVDEPERLALGLRRVPARAYARRHGIPLLAFFHTNFMDYAGAGGGLPSGLLGPVRALGWRAVARLYNGFDATLVPSPASLVRLQRFGLANGVCGPFNGADTAAFTPDLRRSGYWAGRGLPSLEGRVVMLVAGRLTPDKGWDAWGRALPALAARLGPSLAMVIVGDGALMPEVRRMAERVGTVHVIGAVPHPQMPALFANSALYATQSRCENASLAVYEALASGLPVIGPRAGGLPGQVRDGETGLLFAPGDVAGFVAAAARLVEDEGARAAMRAAALAERPRLGWDRAVEAWLEAVAAHVPASKARG
ncbi:glycosyltransferase [Xanthobacter sp. KR7-65]|uniref:glycosyltransferase n=1 Tax=Xanthobacter sp. KR7-65 TaxID=3156612 RepID=UPI0032B603EC